MPYAAATAGNTAPELVDLIAQCAVEAQLIDTLLRTEREDARVAEQRAELHGKLSAMLPETLGAGVFAVAMLAVTGYIDSHDGFPIARCRWVQLALIVVSSVPVFLLPPIAYLIGYYIDRPRRRS